MSLRQDSFCHMFSVVTPLKKRNNQKDNLLNALIICLEYLAMYVRDDV